MTTKLRFFKCERRIRIEKSIHWKTVSITVLSGCFGLLSYGIKEKERVQIVHSRCKRDLTTG